MFTAFTSTCGMLAHIERVDVSAFTSTCGMLVHIERVDVYSVLLLPVVCYSILNVLMFTAFTSTCGMLVHIEEVDVYSVYFYLWYVSPY